MKKSYLVVLCFMLVLSLFSISTLKEISKKNVVATAGSESAISESAISEVMPKEESKKDISEIVSKEESEKGTTEVVPEEGSENATSESIPKEESKKDISEAIPKEESEKGTTEVVPEEESENATSEAIPKEKENRMGESFIVRRTNNTAQIINTKLDSNILSRSKSIEVRVPQYMTINNFSTVTVPSGWGSRFQNSSTSAYKSYTVETNNDANVANVRNFLESLRMTITDGANNNGTITILFHGRSITSFAHPDGKTHYYEFIPFSQIGNLTWFESYNYAKNSHYKNLTGYLTTITSLAEQNFIYNNIAKQGGWLGGSRAIRMGSNQRINDELSIPNTVSSYQFNTMYANSWYWTDGPEAGQTFFNNAVYRNGIDDRIPGRFSYFGNPTNGSSLTEPNNAGNEFVLQFAKFGPQWNDLGYADFRDAKGLYVEYSEYGSQKEAADTSLSQASSAIPEPITITYTGPDGQLLKATDSFGTEAYTIGTMFPVTTSPPNKLTINGVGYLLSAQPKVKETGKVASFPLQATATKQTVEANYQYEKVWGNVPWEFDEPTGIVTFYGGTPTTSNLSTSNESPWNRQDDKAINKSDVKRIIFTQPVNAPADSSRLFTDSNKLNPSPNYLVNVTSIEGLNKVNTTNVTNMSFMFYNASNLSNIDVSNWNTANVTDMSFIFLRTSSLSNLDVSKWKTSNVTNMEGTFNQTSSLKTLNISGWNTSKVTDMSTMFHRSGINSIDLSSWNTSEVTNMSTMFGAAENLTSLNVSNWDTSKVTDMTTMFFGLSQLEYLNLSSWDTSKVTSKERMFSGTTKLSRLTLGSKFNSMARTGLPAIASTKVYTSKWLLDGKNYVIGDSSEFMRDYQPTKPGTYRWQRKVNLGFKQVYKEKPTQAIYSDLVSEQVVDNTQSRYTVGESDNLQQTIDQLIDNHTDTFRLNYTGYQPIISSDYTVQVGGAEVSIETVPDTDVTIVYGYEGILNVQAPNVNFGKKKIATKKQQIIKNPDESQTVNLTNTTLGYSKIMVRMTKDMIDSDTNTTLKGGLFVQKDRERIDIGSEPSSFYQQDGTNKRLITDIPINMNLFQDIGNEPGNYEGEILWTLVDGPTN